MNAIAFLNDKVQSDIRPLHDRPVPHVENQATANEAGEFSKALSRALNVVEDRRKEMVKPLNDRVKEINTQAKQLAAPLLVKRTQVNNAIFTWQQAEQARADAERRKAEEEAAARVVESKGKAEEALPPLPDKPVAAPQKTMQTRKLTKWEVTDFSKVPDGYKTINTAAVNQALASGRAVPGIRHWTEEVPVNRFN